jgi:hypothetical protein
VIVMPSGLSTASMAECRALAAAFSMYPGESTRQREEQLTWAQWSASYLNESWSLVR